MRLLWADLPFVVGLARAGTLNGAARVLKVDRTTIARRIEQLENALNVPLFDRAGGRFILTAFGRQVFAAAESAEQELAFLTKRQQAHKEPSGRIRVSLSEHVLMTLTGCFRDFTKKYPDILLELTATDRIVDLAHFESDVALRLSRNFPDDLLVRKIGKPIFALYRKRGLKGAGRHYIARPSEHRVPSYILKHAPLTRVAIAADGIVSMRELIANGLGIGVLPRYFGDQDARIECCSGPVSNANFTFFIASRPEQRRLHRIVAFVAHVEDYMSRMEGFTGE